MQRIIFSPGRYLQGDGMLDETAGHCRKIGGGCAYAVVDPFILEHYETRITAGFEREGFPLRMERFSGECSDSEIQRVIGELKQADADIILGIGGGKTLDTAKAAAYFANIPVVIIPTIASTDAPCSALSVVYQDDGTFDRYLFLNRNPDIVLVDTSLIAAAPARLLVAGMGDALATYFEARACYRSGARSMAGAQCSEAAMALARLCYDMLLRDGEMARISADRHVVSRALENVIEANTYLSGIGFESGGLAAAHAVHNGLTVLEEAHSLYHGEKVAFGTLVQLVLENAEPDELNTVIRFCKTLGLPTTLSQLGVHQLSHDRLLAVAETACSPDDTMHNMPFAVTPQLVAGAIVIADEMGK